LISDHKKLCAEEKALVNEVFLPARASDLEILREEILLGLDPLGEAFARIRSPKSRRSSGAVYTPATIVDSMMKWLASKGVPDRIVDPGAGSGRFILSAGEFFPEAELIAVEFDPLAALMLRANIEVRGWSDRTKILVKDYRQIKLPKCLGTTAFIGNPPYVRHHDIDENWKNWYSEKFATFGIKASALAGLHLHFFLQTRLLAKKGDIGAFITSAEWMDVNYGSALRRLLLEELGRADAGAECNTVIELKSGHHAAWRWPLASLGPSFRWGI
jgi:type I restriction-modification system DNA methylase subunit